MAREEKENTYSKMQSNAQEHCVVCLYSMFLNLKMSCACVVRIMDG